MMPEKQKSIATEPSSLETLPDEIILYIMNCLGYLGYKEWTKLARVSRRMSRIAFETKR